MVERNAVLYRREWTLIVSGFFEPLLYLLAIGYGVGGLVGSAVTLNGRPIAYAAFVAPAMMASSAMNGAIYETAFNFFYKLKYVKLYDAILATPLGVADVALGEVTWALIRGTLYALGFIVVMAALAVATGLLVVALEGGLKLEQASSAALDRLGAREREVLALRFGLGGGPALSLKEVGRRIGASRDWARKLEKAALAEKDQALVAETQARSAISIL